MCCFQFFYQYVFQYVGVPGKLSHFPFRYIGYVCMYVCMYVYIYIHTYIHIPIIFNILSIFPLLICFPNMLLVLQNLFSNDVFHMWRFPKIRGTPSHQAGPTPWLNPPVFPSDFSMWRENAQETLYFQGNMVSFRFPTN